MNAIAAGEAAPLLTRVSDAPETQFSFATRPVTRCSTVSVEGPLSAFLERRRHFDLDPMCLSFIGYEGSKRHVAAQRKLVGASSGATRARHRHRPWRPYTIRSSTPPTSATSARPRALADGSETSAPWSALPGLYDT